MKLAIALLLISEIAHAQIQTEWTLYRNGQAGLQGQPSGAWNWPGVAMTASMSLLYANKDLAIESCRWAFSWNPNTGPSPTGVRLVAFYNGQITPLQQVTIANRSTPTSDGRDVTAQMKWLVANKTPAWLAMQTVGNGAVGPLIYHSIIECIWE